MPFRSGSHVQSNCGAHNTASRSVICVRGPHAFVKWKGRIRRDAKFSGPSHEACGVLRHATPWFELHSHLFRNAFLVPLKPLRENRRSPWHLPPTSRKRATCLAFIIQLHDCRRRCKKRRRCGTNRWTQTSPLFSQDSNTSRVLVHLLSVWHSPSSPSSCTLRPP